jgi:nucleotide sugar dehydrogenase
MLRLLDGRHDVVSWDVQDDTDLPVDELGACDLFVVCVPTPECPDGRLDTSHVEDVIARVPVPRVLLKSTVPPGTVDRLRARHGREICYWPEYVGQSNYFNPHFPSEITDVPFVILGGESSIATWCMKLLQPMLGPTKTYFRCTAIEAEMIKLAENAYFATKVTFVNELKQICDAVGADWDTVREGWLLDPRIERMHTLVFDGDPGFSGACLPKDLRGLVAAARDAGYLPTLLAEVLAANERIRRGES